MFLSIHLNSNNPKNIFELVENINSTAANPKQIEIIVNIDDGDEASLNNIKILQKKNGVVIKYIQTNIYVNDTIDEIKTCVIFKHTYNKYKVGSLWSITSPYEYHDGIESNDKAREYFIFGKNLSITNERIRKMLRGEDVTLTLNTMNGIYNRSYNIYKKKPTVITNKVNLCCTFSLFAKKNY